MKVKRKRKTMEGGREKVKERNREMNSEIKVK